MAGKIMDEMSSSKLFNFYRQIHRLVQVSVADVNHDSDSEAMP